MSLSIRNKISLLLAIGYWLLATCSFAQDTLPQKKLFINFTGHYGFIIAHHANMDYLIKHHVPAGDIQFIRVTNGERPWEKIYHNPEMGLGIFYAYLGNPQELGNAIGVYPFVNFPLNPRRKFKLYFKVCDGIGLITKPYNRVDNHKNNINGSYINCYISFRLSTEFYPAKNIRMEAGIAASHLSNGALAMPNLGINLATVNLGISFLKTEKKKATTDAVQKPKPEIYNHKYSFLIFGAAGPNQTTPPDGKEYAGFTLSASCWLQATPKSKFGAGVDAIYDFSNIEDAKRDTAFDTNNSLNNLQIGVKLGYELVIGKIALPIEMGYYVVSKTKTDGPFYHRIGIRYYVNKHLVIIYSLKTQWAVAENLEFGIGYRF